MNPLTPFPPTPDHSRSLISPSDSLAHQVMNLVMERYEDLQGPVLQCISLLCVVLEYNVGEMCLNCLHYHLTSRDDDFRDLVNAVIKENVVPFVINTGLMNISGRGRKVSNMLLRAVARLAAQGGMDHFLLELVPPIQQSILTASATGVIPIGPLLAPVFAAIMQLPDAAGLVNQEMAEAISDEVVRLNENNLNISSGALSDDGSVYLHLLRCITGMATYHIDNTSDESEHDSDPYYMARFFSKKGRHLDALRYLQRRIDSVGTTLTAEENICITAALDCVSALCLSPSVAISLINSPLRLITTVFRVCRKATEFATRVLPSTLAAAYRLLLMLLDTPHSAYVSARKSTEGRETTMMVHLKTQQDVHIAISEGLQSGLMLMRYLNESDQKYFRRMVRDTKQMSEANQLGRGHKQMYTLTSLDATYRPMHELLVATIRLVHFYSLSKSSESIAVSGFMDMQKREQRLFATLKVPSDAVRNVAVMCVSVLPLEQVDAPEVRILLDSLSSISNLTAGETEVMLAEAFNFLTRVALDVGPTGQTFRLKPQLAVEEIGESNVTSLPSSSNGTDNSASDNADGVMMGSGEIGGRPGQSNAEVAIDLAFNIIGRIESSRSWRAPEDDAMQKHELLGSIIAFLQVCSSCSTLRSFLDSGNATNSLCLVLRHEHEECCKAKWSLESEDNIPVTAERTWAGRKVGPLLHLVSTLEDQSVDGGRGDAGSSSSTGFGNMLVPERLLGRIADVLMGIPDPDFDRLQNTLGGVEVMMQGQARYVDEVPSPCQPRSLAKVYARQPVLCMQVFGKLLHRSEMTSGAGTENVEHLMTANIDDHRAARSRGLHMLRYLRKDEVKQESEIHQWWFPIASEETYTFFDNAGGARDQITTAQLDPMTAKQHIYCSQFGGIEEIFNLVRRLHKARHTYATAMSEDKVGGVSRRFSPFPGVSLLHVKLSQFLTDLDAMELVKQMEHPKVVSLSASDVDLPPTFANNEESDDGRVFLKKSLMCVDDEHWEHANPSREFKPLAEMLVFKTKTNRVNSSVLLRRKMNQSSRLLAPLLRALFALLNFGTVQSQKSIVNKLLDPQNGYFLLLAEAVTVSMNAPQWRECNIGAKFLALARTAIPRFSFLMAKDGTQKSAIAFTEAIFIVSRIWLKLVDEIADHGSTDDNALDPFLIQATLTVSECLMRLPYLADLILPKQADGNMAAGRGRRNNKRKWLGLEYLVSNLVPERVWKPLVEVLSRASSICRHKVSVLSDADLSRLTTLVGAISNILEVGMLVCPGHRFTILETIASLEVAEQFSFPKSILQQVLSRIPVNAEFDRSMLELANLGLLFTRPITPSEVNSRETVFAMSWVHIGSPLTGSCRVAEEKHAPIKGLGPGGKHPNMTIVEKRDFLVVTSRRLSIFRRRTPLSLLRYAQSTWENIASIDLSNVSRVVAGLTRDRVYITSNTFHVNEHVQVSTSSMNSAHVGTILAINLGTKMYRVRIDLGAPLRCTRCGQQFATHTEMRAHQTYEHDGKDDDQAKDQGFQVTPDGPFVEMSLSQHELLPLDQESFTPEILTVAFPSKQRATRIIACLKEVIAFVTGREIQIERDVCSAMSIRHLIRDHVLEHRRSPESNAPRVPVPRDFKTEPLVSIAKLFDPNCHGKFLGLVVLIMTSSHVFICDEHLESWQLPFYWRTDARISEEQNAAVYEKGILRIESKNAMEKDNLASNADHDDADMVFRGRIATYKSQIKNAIARQKSAVRVRRETFSTHAKTIFTVRNSPLVTSSRAIPPLANKAAEDGADLSVHSLSSLMEFAPGKKLPVFYLGFSSMEKDGVPFFFSSRDDSFTSQSVSKYRYMFQLDSFVHTMQWQRALAPWVKKLKRRK